MSSRTDHFDERSGDGSSQHHAALRQLATACQRVVAGKLAAREIASWVRDLGLTEAEFRLLCLLQFDAPRLGPGARALDQATMAEQLALSPAQVSGMVERLGAGGFIEPVHGAADRRRQLWRIALAGQLLISNVLTLVRSHQSDVSSRDSAVREVA